MNSCHCEALAETIQEKNLKLFGLSRRNCVSPRNDAKIRNFRSPSSAFTLAEVLITLGIIGVVAALTIPIIYNSVQDAQYKTAYKKAYSVLSQALTSASGDNALINVTANNDASIGTNFQTIMSYIKTTKTCYSRSDAYSCWNQNGEYWNAAAGSDGPSNIDFSVIDVSGMNWATYGNFYVSSLLVDTNGFNPPNQYGKDRFRITIKDINNNSLGVPSRVLPENDNNVYACTSNVNKCGTVGNKDYNTYYATSWLYN